MRFILPSSLRFAVVFFFCGAGLFGQSDAGAAWKTAVSRRAASFTFAPASLPYEQKQLERDGSVSHRERGRMSVTYAADGEARIGIVWAQRDGKNFTGERGQRLAKQAGRRSEFLSLATPFDPDVQDRLKRGEGKLVYEEGRFFWSYDFRLPLGGGRAFVGKARVRENGEPHDVRFSAEPLPWFLDVIDVHLVFDAGGRGLPHSAEFGYRASFLFWLWRGEGRAFFEDWRDISVPPRLGGNRGG
jgi:hypothetical protein